MSHRAGTAHLGSSLSCADILVAIYWDILNLDPDNPQDPDRDRMILSKGHAAPLLYAQSLPGFPVIGRSSTYLTQSPVDRLSSSSGDPC